mgnify:CR=1 FL=1
MAYKPGDAVDRVLRADNALRVVGGETQEQQPPEATGQDQTAPGQAMPPLEETMPSVKAGQIVEGVVVAVSENEAVIDVGSKAEGTLSLDEFRSPLPGAPPPEVKIGDKVEVFVAAIGDEQGTVRLSKKRADYEKAWRRVYEARDTGEVLSAIVTERVKGGVRVDLGIPGFVPASHSGFRNPNVLDRIVGSTIPVRVIEADKKANKVILSRRLAVEDERKQKREDLFAELREGQVVKGRVRSLVEYGAFVDLGGADGLLHVSEMSWTRLEHPSELLKIGDEIEVMVLRVDRERHRISLGLRQITPDPWQELVKQVQEGAVLKVKVSRLAPRAVFVKLPNHVEGIIPLSELSLERLTSPAEAVHVGDEFEAMVISISPAERKILLSRRRVEESFAPVGGGVVAYSTGGTDEPVTLGDVYGDLLRSAATTVGEETRAEAQAGEAEVGGAEGAETIAEACAEEEPSQVPAPAEVENPSQTAEAEAPAEGSAEEQPEA